MMLAQKLLSAKSVKEWNILKRLLIFSALVISGLCSKGQTSYTWNAAAGSSSWASASNWTPAGVPIAGDNVTIVAAANAPLYDGTVLNNFTITSGSIDLGGGTLVVNGNATFTSGTVANGRVSAQGGATVFTNTTFNCKVYSSTSNVTISGGTFNDSTTIIKNGTTDQTMAGNAVFNAPLSLRITNTGRMAINGNMTFNGVTSLYNAGQDYFILENTTANQYNNDLYLTIAGSNAGDIRLGYRASITYHGDVYVSSESGNGDIFLSEGAAYGATLAAGKHIFVGSGGFNSGNLWVQRVTQAGTENQSIELTGTASLRLGPSTTFNGKTDFKAPRVFLNGVTCNDSSFIVKKGTGGDLGLGGNTFNGYVSLINAATSNGYFRTSGNNTFNGTLKIENYSTADVLPDLTLGSSYNGTTVLYKHAAGSIRMAFNGTSNFNGDIIVNNTHASNSIIFCESAAANATLAAGRVIEVGGSGFTGGTLTLQRFTQAGATPQTLALTGGSLTLGASVVFNGNANFSSIGTGTVTISNGDVLNGKVTVVAPRVLLNGATFADSTWISKTGAGSSVSTGGNTFNSFVAISVGAAAGQLRINNGNTYHGDVVLSNASTQPLELDYSSGSTYNSKVFITKSGAGSISIARNGANVFNEHIELNSTHASGGIYFGDGTSSAITLASNKRIIVGAGGVSGGLVQIQRMSQSGTTLQDFTFSGNASLNLLAGNTFANNVNISLAGTGIINLGSTTNFNGQCHVSAPQVLLNGATFGDSTWITKTGVGANTGNGGNIFQSYASVSLAATAGGFLRTNYGNTYNGTLELSNASGQELLLGLIAASTYSGDVLLRKTGAGNLRVAYAGANTFGGDIVLNNTQALGSIAFCEGTGAAATLASGKKFLVGPSGVSAGTVLIQNITQSSATDQDFTFTGNASLNLAKGNNFAGNVNVDLVGTGVATIGATNTLNGKNTITAPQLFLSGTTFGDSTWITKTGIANNTSNGSNTFNGFVSISLAPTAGGYLRTNYGNTFAGNVVVSNSSGYEILLDYLSGSTYNGNVVLNKTGAGNVRVAYSGTNVFNENIELNCTHATGGIYLGEATAAAITLASGKTIAAGSVGITAGVVSIRNFTQLGNTPQVLNLSGTASLYFNSGNTFNGDVTSTLSGLGTFTVAAGNIFNAKTNFTAPQLLLHGATFADSSIIEKNGSGSNSSAGGNVFSGFALLKNSSNGTFIMGATNADTFAQKTVLLNTGAGYLFMANNHIGKTTFFGDTLIAVNSSVVAAGNPGIRFCEGNSTACEFNGVVIASNEGTGASNLIRFQNGLGQSVFNRRVYFNNNCSGSASIIDVSYRGNAVFNDNAYCSATGGTGVSFGRGNGTSAFSSTCRILLGAGGYSASNFLLNKVQQLGARGPVTISLGGATILTVSNSSFGEEIDFIAPQVNFVRDTFNNAVRITKNGIGNNAWTGGNVFNDSAIITNESSSYLYLAATIQDEYNGNAKFVRTGGGLLDPTYNTAVTFKNTLETAGTGVITFGTFGANGYVVMAGDSLQTIVGAPALTPAIRRLTIDKNPAYPVVLHTPVDIAANGLLTLTNGKILSDSLNVLTLLNNATSNIGNKNAYVDGHLNYEMAAATTRLLTFPIGRDTVYRPVELTVRHNAATSYTYAALLKNESARALNRTLSDSINLVSDMRIWKIERMVTATKVKSNANLQGNQVITLYYDSSDYVEDAANLRIVKNTSAQPNKWISIGGVGSANGAGFITSTSNPSAFNSFSDFSLGNKNGGGNPLPVTLLHIKATAASKQINLEWATGAEINNKGFEVQRSTDGENFEAIGWVDGNGYTTETISYTFEDKKVTANVVYYYRLKQIDFDAQFEITKVVSAMVKEGNTKTIEWASIATLGSAQAKLMLNAAAEGVLSVRTFNLSGALIYDMQQPVYVGLNQIEMQFEQALASGTYITEVSINNETKYIKWVSAK
ncbi:MAG: hypothetical protein U0T72_05030 [Chitinophagales bacterium]